MNAQVFTTTRSASSTPFARSRPSAYSVPTILSESTTFFGQPSVSMGNRRGTTRWYSGPLRTLRDVNTSSNDGELVELGEWPRLSAQILRRRLDTAGIPVMVEWSDKAAGGIGT